MLVVIPTEKEFAAFLAASGARGFHTESLVLGRISVRRIIEMDGYAARGGLGKVEFGVRTQHLLDHYEAPLVVCVGGAGALAETVVIGDVVVATETVEHDFKNRFTSRPAPRFSATENVVDALRASPMNTGFATHFGRIASGDEDVVHRERAEALREQTGAMAVAWEGAGGARAAAFSGVPFVEIRGITDHADPSASASYDNNLELAMSNVVSVLMALSTRNQGSLR